MKTIEEASVEYSKEQYDHDPIMRFQCETHFEAGIEFAQRWIPIERDNEGLVKYSTMDEMESNVPFITRLTNDEGFLYDIWYEFG